MTNRALSVLLAVIFLIGCRNNSPPPPAAKAALAPLTLATTTSMQDSGLLDALLPEFQAQSGITVRVVAKGSGEVLELARRGDADVIITHSPDAEKKFIEEGFSAARRTVMHSDFVILGPVADSAGIKGDKSASAALRKIAEKQAKFVSRGDESGTHAKEKSLWKQAQQQPTGAWYLSAGTGMAQALRMANEKRAYILCDRATYLALKKEIDLEILVAGDKRLLNIYSVTLISQAKHPHLNHDAARQFADFLLSSQGQELIGAYGAEKYGQPLFTPDANLASPQR